MLDGKVVLVVVVSAKPLGIIFALAHSLRVILADLVQMFVTLQQSGRGVVRLGLVFSVTSSFMVMRRRMVFVERLVVACPNFHHWRMWLRGLSRW